jgi:hypothetical protein
VTTLGPLTVEIEPIACSLVFVTDTLQERVARKLVEIQERDCGEPAMTDEEWADFWPKFGHVWGPDADEVISVILTS